MSKKDPKKSGRKELRESMKKMFQERLSKNAEEKGFKPKRMMKATIIAEDQEGLGEGAKTLAEMMLEKYRDQNKEE